MIDDFKLDNDKLTKELFADDVSKKWLKSILNSNICTITFTKKNGDQRVMKCTLDEQHFPAIQKEATEVSEVRQKSTEALSVFDVEAQGWRSFRWDSIIKFEMTLE
jgi:dephospho-CoA kinase